MLGTNVTDCASVTVNCSFTVKCLDFPSTWEKLGGFYPLTIAILLLAGVAVGIYATSEILRRKRESLNIAKILLFFNLFALLSFCLSCSAGLAIYIQKSCFVVKNDKLKDFVAFRLPQTLWVACCMMLSIFWQKAFKTIKCQTPFVNGRKSVIVAIGLLFILEITVPYYTSMTGTKAISRIGDIILGLYIIGIFMFSAYYSSAFLRDFKSNGSLSCTLILAFATLYTASATHTTSWEPSP